jgi:hypothetical protein
MKEIIFDGDILVSHMANKNSNENFFSHMEGIVRRDLSCYFCFRNMFHQIKNDMLEVLSHE